MIGMRRCSSRSRRSRFARPSGSCWTPFAPSLPACLRPRSRSSAGAGSTLRSEMIEVTCATVCRQATMYCCEQEEHRRRRVEAELPLERLNEIWQTTMQEMFGPSLRLGEEHRWWWLYIPHVYHTPFYVYAY